MFNQIIKIIWNQRTSNAWIWAEMALVSICLWYIIDDLYIRANLYFSPMGYDISNVYTVDLRLLTGENEQYHLQSEYGTTLGEDLLTLVSRMRTYPGVEAAGISESSVPYSRSRNYNPLTRIREGNDTLNIGMVRRYFGTPDYIRVFRYATPQGNTEILTDNLTFNQVIISQEIETALYPEGNATGKLIDYNLNDSLNTYIGGVMMPMRFGDFDTYSPTFILPMAEKVIAEQLNELHFRSMQVTLRTNPSIASKDFMANFKKDMKNQLRYNNIYMLNIRSYDDIRARYIRSDVNETKMYLAGVFFLLVNIFLGIVGTFWFRTQHRLGEMGLRIALGSTSANLRSILIGEGLVILLFAIVPAAIVSFNLGLNEIINVEAMPFTIVRFLACQAVVILLMVIMITAGVWFPSRKVVHLQPAESLRYE